MKRFQKARSPLGSLGPEGASRLTWGLVYTYSTPSGVARSDDKLEYQLERTVADSPRVFTI
jgi:hypothetical protein